MDRHLKRILTISSITLAVAGFVLYAYFQSREYLRGPILIVEEPSNGFLATTSLIFIAGRSKNISFLTLNGKQNFTNEQGRFRESLLLEEGYSIMTLEAKDRFGHTATKKLELVYKPKSAEIVIPPFQGEE